MTELELLQAIGSAQDVHILDAEELPVKKRFPLRPMAALLALVLTAALFLQTPMGAAAVEVVKEQVTRFLELIFPPKDIVIYREGEPETVHVEALGREPEANSPGFSIYVDTAAYTMTEENGSWFIRPLKNSVKLPPVEMEIREFPDKSPTEAAVMVRAQMEGKWENLSDIGNQGQTEKLLLNASKKSGDSNLWERHEFRGNSAGGCFHIIVRGDRYAEEDHGSQFLQMLETFTLVAPQDAGQYYGESDALLKAMEQEVVYARNQDVQNTAAERAELWREVHGKLWTALEQTLDADSFQDLVAEELNWAAQKRIPLDQIQKVWDEENARKTMERVEILLRYLQGTAKPAQRGADMEFSPKPTVEAFADDWFQKNAEHSLIHAIKGLDNVMEDMADKGCLNASVEFRPTADSDYYNYLSITLIWENTQWAVESYGLEG